MTEGEAIYRAILANPADDTPRLVYADWLQEHGQEEWAEFVRVQCELETTDERRCGGYYCQTYDTGNTMHVDCRWEYLNRRQRELWPAVVQRVSYPSPGSISRASSVPGHGRRLGSAGGRSLRP